MVEHIYFFFTGATNVQSTIGVPIKMGRVWLDIIMPPSPPPEYEQSGYVKLLVRNYEMGCELMYEQLGDHS